MLTVARPRLWVGLIAAALLLLLLATLLRGQERIRPIPRPGVSVVEVTAVQPRGPAYRAGLEVGDRILEIDGVRIRSLSELQRSLYEAGYSARLTVQQRRTGREATVYVYPESGRIGIDARMVEAYPYPYGRYPY